ncbi:MAG: hypothetical protein MZU95_11850 [Desulfomicrobium escambiense]|nr:hypothetical protein [Desulfomicrobium escambiense]
MAEARQVAFNEKYTKRFGERLNHHQRAVRLRQHVHNRRRDQRGRAPAEPEAIRAALETTTKVKILQGDGSITLDPKTHRPDNMPLWMFKWEGGQEGTAEAVLSLLIIIRTDGSSGRGRL